MQVLQEFQQQLFVQKNLVFQQAAEFLFQPIDSDTVNQPLYVDMTVNSVEVNSLSWEVVRCFNKHCFVVLNLNPLTA